MKINIIKILLLVTFCLSCNEDRLDIEPTVEIPLDDVDKTEEHLEGVKNGIYYQLSRTDAFGRSIIALGDIVSDDAFQSVKNSGRFTRLNDISYSQESNDVALILDALYNVLPLANAVINTSLPETERVKRAKAEALVGRALTLFYAVNIYSPSVASGVYQEYGVPVFTGKYDYKRTYPRSTIQQVYEQIENDLSTSISLFNNWNPSQKTFFGLDAAKLLLARVYLYQQKWQKSLDLLVDLESKFPASIDTYEGNREGKDKYLSYFLTDNSPQTIFELGYSTTNSLGIDHIAGVYAIDGAYKDIEFRQSLYNLIDSLDVRTAVFQYDEKDIGVNGSQKGYFIKKYTPAASYSQNIKILRVTEIRLNKIEALYRLGRETQALTELNEFVQSRGATYTYISTGNQLLEDILKERRLEFVGEGHRFFDLKRNMLPINRTSNCSTCNLNATDYRFVMPIPQWEMDYNPNMSQYILWGN